MRRNANITGRFDEDLLEHSVEPVETLVKVGESLGKSLVASGASFDLEAVLRAADAKLAAMGLPPGERPTLAQAASMIDSAVEAADRFHPAFDFPLKGKTAYDAMSACMFETVGQA